MSIPFPPTPATLERNTLYGHPNGPRRDLDLLIILNDAPSVSLRKQMTDEEGAEFIDREITDAKFSEVMPMPEFFMVTWADLGEGETPPVVLVGHRRV